MQASDAYDRNSRSSSLMLAAAAIAAALVAGAITALAGSMAGTRAVYLVTVPCILAIAAGIALTRTQPLRFAFLVIVALLPFVAILMPPGRLGLTVFDVASLLLAVGLLLHKAFAPDPYAPLFPAPALGWVWVLLLPSAVFARHPLEATQALVLIFAGYVFFWFALQELRRPNGFERLTSLLAVSVVIIAGGLFVDHFLHINLSLRGSNLNQLTVIEGGIQIWRAGGFFQDPQKAGGFLAILLTFLLVLVLRGRIRGTWPRVLVWGAILVGVPALFLTVSRAAIGSFMVVSILVLAAANRWPVALKLAGFIGLGLLAGSLVVAPEFWASLLPGPLAERVMRSQAEFLLRVEIWLDTWDMFADHPVTGIGFGGFQQYLLDTRPGVFDYYGIGEQTGVAYVPDQPESGYFKILYEGGILGSLAALLLAGASLRRAGAALFGRLTSADTRSEVMAAIAGLTVFASTFATLFTTVDPRMLAVFAILLAVLWRPSTPSLYPTARS